MEAEDWQSGVSGRVKALFGKPLRALLAAWILDRGDHAFFLQEAQLSLARFGAAGSGVATELRVLVSHGMLLEAEDGRRVYFTRVSSPVWSVYEAMATALELRPVGATSPVSRS